MRNANRTPLIHNRLDPTSQRLLVEDVRVGLALAQVPATGYSVTGAQHTSAFTFCGPNNLKES